MDFITAKENVIFLGPPGTGKTHLATGLAIKACHAGHRVKFATAADWITRLANAHDAGRFPDELKRLSRIPLLVIDEIGYLPFEPEAANLSSNSSPPAMSEPPSSSPATNPSAARAKSSATTPSPRP